MSHELNVEELARLRALIDIKKEVINIRCECVEYFAEHARGNKFCYMRGMISAADRIESFIDDQISQTHRNAEGDVR